MFNRFREAVELALKEKKALYTKETASDFHCLLYLSFIMAGRALREIKDSYALTKQHHKSLAEVGDAIADYNLKTAISAAELSVRFLVCMVSSSVFKLHMRVWTNEELSLKHMLPRYGEKGNYMRFGKEREILASAKLGPQSDSEDLDDDTTEVCEVIC